MGLTGARVLVVDDDADMRQLLDHWLGAAGAEVRMAADGESALALASRQPPDLLLTDLVMGEMDGLRLVSEMHRQLPLLPVVMVSGQAGVGEAMRAAHLGVSAFLGKPLDRDEVLTQAQAALAGAARAGGAPGERFAPAMVRRAPVMETLLDRARLVAASDCTVLLTGPTGSGKELLARAIHEASARATRPMVSVNCSAIPETLLESELFGHEKGAFTGAHGRRDGLFQAADGGTLFLDEIGDMPLALQARLLRVLQDFQVRPLGATRATPVDVRIISATHHDLEAAVADRRFREDLYYRLSVVPLMLPPLAGRREDIVPLAERFLDEFAAPAGVRKQLAPQARQLLATAELPGNVRQLRNVIERCVVLSPSAVIAADLVAEALNHRTGSLPTYEQAMRAYERRYLESVLRLAEGNVSGAARLAGRNRTEFYKLLNRHGLRADDFRGG